MCEYACTRVHTRVRSRHPVTHTTRLQALVTHSLDKFWSLCETRGREKTTRREDPPHPPTLSQLDFFYLTAPLLLHGDPPRGLSTGGTILTISGTSLVSPDTGRYRCRFGASLGGLFPSRGSDVLGTLDGLGRLICTTPPLPPGGVSIQVSLNGLQYSVSSVSLAVQTPPVIHEISPLRGPADGGTHILLQGSALHHGTPYSCRFSRIETDSSQLVNATRAQHADALTCVTPAASASAALVEVTLNSQQFVSGGLKQSYKPPLTHAHSRARRSCVKCALHIR